MHTFQYLFSVRDRTLDFFEFFFSYISSIYIISFFPFSLSRYSKINNSVVTSTKNWTHEKKKKRKYYKEYQNVYFVALASLFIKLKNIINYPPKKQKKKRIITPILSFMTCSSIIAETREIYSSKNSNKQPTHSSIIHPPRFVPLRATSSLEPQFIIVTRQNPELTRPENVYPRAPLSFSFFLFSFFSVKRSQLRIQRSEKPETCHGITRI